jgi:hypothetical protein
MIYLNEYKIRYILHEQFVDQLRNQLNCLLYKQIFDRSFRPLDELLYWQFSASLDWYEQLKKVVKK